MHSWRVLLLPYLDETALYNAYRFDELWNGPNNRKLLRSMPALYACPSYERAKYTSYVAVVSPRTSWPGSLGRKIDEFKDGTSDTIMVIDVHD